MNPSTALTLAGLASLGFCGNAGAADVHTRTIAATCMSCHGPGGRSLGSTPSLAGLEPAYFVQTLKDFRSGAKPGTIMKRHASGYTDAEIEALGAYFASLK
jgi:cytochrome c553